MEGVLQEQRSVSIVATTPSSLRLMYVDKKLNKLANKEGAEIEAAEVIDFSGL
jgi:hypothetical protein